MLGIILLLIVALFIIKYIKDKKSTSTHLVNKLSHEDVLNTSEDEASQMQSQIVDEIQLPYKKKNLFTKNEYRFYMQLAKVTAEENLIVFPKVRLEDFIETTCENQKDKLKFRGHIKSRHVDFLICNEKLNIMAAIELDDPSHYNKKSKEIDSFKNNVFNTIKIPLHRVNPGSDYNAAIENIIKEIKRPDASV